jgi:hypothetical protein
MTRRELVCHVTGEIENVLKEMKNSNKRRRNRGVDLEAVNDCKKLISTINHYKKMIQKDPNIPLELWVHYLLELRHQVQHHLKHISPIEVMARQSDDDGKMSISSVAIIKSDLPAYAKKILTIIEETLDSIGNDEIRIIFTDRVKESSNELASQITKAAEIELISLKRCENTECRFDNDLVREIYDGSLNIYQGFIDYMNETKDFTAEELWETVERLAELITVNITAIDEALSMAETINSDEAFSITTDRKEFLDLKDLLIKGMTNIANTLKSLLESKGFDCEGLLNELDDIKNARKILDESFKK